MKRRTLFKYCAVAAGCAAMPGAFLASGQARAEAYPRSLLIGRDGAPLRAEQVRAATNYIFHYPYISTPCFLLRLPEAPEPRQLRTRNGEEYQWHGGAGPDGTLVAFSAICAHKMAHPTRQTNFISFRPDVTDIGSGKGVISCCAENSVYDPAQGAEVLGGPAPEPLAAILLEYDVDADTLSATGVAGGEMFHRFFSEYGGRLSIEHETAGEQYDAHIGEETTVRTLEAFSAQTLTCAVDPDSDDPGLLGR